MAWAAAGMSRWDDTLPVKSDILDLNHVTHLHRVYSTYKYGPHASRLSSEMSDLANWSNEILAATFAYQV